MKHEFCPLCAPQPTIGNENVELSIDNIGIIHWIEDEGFEGEGFCDKCKRSVRKCGICGKIIEESEALHMVSPKEQYICKQCYNEKMVRK